MPSILEIVPSKLIRWIPVSVSSVRGRPGMRPRITADGSNPIRPAQPEQVAAIEPGGDCVARAGHGANTAIFLAAASDALALAAGAAARTTRRAEIARRVQTRQCGRRP